jgi:hypothetical protein
MFHKFRKRDIALPIGCSNKAALLQFNISKTPVVSSFVLERDANFYKSAYVPVLPVDIALRNIDFKYISFLSIDVEGLNLQVLEGAIETIQKTLLVCLEYESDHEKEQFAKILGNTFVLASEFGCNVIYLNARLSKEFLIVE